MRTMIWVLLAVVSGLAGFAQAEEKNGLMVTVAKKTLDRNDTRAPAYYYSDRIDRTQGLRVTVKNNTFKTMPAGEITWMLVVRKYYSGSSLEGFMGKEPLKALKPSESAELVMGSAQILGWNDMGGQAKDKIEYQVVVTQEGKEMIRTQSTAGFDALAKQAIFSSPSINRGPPKGPPTTVPATPAPGLLGRATPSPATPAPGR